MVTTPKHVLIIGAGAAGLMAARTLTQAGLRVTVCEAMPRIGGRIFSLPKEEFGYPAQAGAEFVHGAAPITKQLIKEAHLEFIPEAEDGEIWDARGGSLTLKTSFITQNEELKAKLQHIDPLMSVYDFLMTNFGDEAHYGLRNSILKMIEAYEAADPRRLSVTYLQRDVLGKIYHSDGWVKGGYGELLTYLEKECVEHEATIVLDSPVTSLEIADTSILVVTPKARYEVDAVLVTVSVSALSTIKCNQSFDEKIKAASQIGFGGAIKMLISFKNQWWKEVPGKNLSTMSFALSNDDFGGWWTQYPIETNTLTGWMAGPNAEHNANLTDDQLYEMAITSLARLFEISETFLRDQVTHWRCTNWVKIPYVGGGYSYTAIGSDDAYETLRTPIGTVYFAGEALYSKKEDRSTVEAALGSGQEVAQEIIKRFSDHK